MTALTRANYFPMRILRMSARMEPIMAGRSQTIIAPDDPGPDIMADAFSVRVEKVFDGDGFLAQARAGPEQRWDMRIPFRFAFIDAPELDQPCGPQSRAFLRGLIEGRSVTLLPIGKESTGFSPVDPYRRMLCMGFVAAELQPGTISYYHQGVCCTKQARKPRSILRNVELEMIANGWAWVIERYAFEREDEYRAAQVDARDNRRGLWALASPEPPWAFKRRQRRQRSIDFRQPKLF